MPLERHTRTGPVNDQHRAGVRVMTGSAEREDEDLVVVWPGVSATVPVAGRTPQGAVRRADHLPQPAVLTREMRHRYAHLARGAERDLPQPLPAHGGDPEADGGDRGSQWRRLA